MRERRRFGSIPPMRCDSGGHIPPQPEGRPRLMHRAWFVVCLFLVGMTGMGCGEDTAPAPVSGKSKEPSKVRVEVVEARPEEFVHKVALTGQLDAEHSVLLKPEIEGVVESIHGTEGGPVKKGDILFLLKDAEQRARVNEAEADVRLAEDVFQRTQRLSMVDISSQARRAEAVAKLDAARAKLARAKVNLERTRIRAPFDGVLGSRLVSPGAKMEERDGLITLDAIDRLQLTFTVQEMGVPLARVGGRVGARVIAYPGRVFPGEVYFVSPNIDPSTRRLFLKAWVPNKEHLLKPGMFANVDVEVARKLDTIMLPESAMIYDRHGTYVWRADEEGKAQKVPVKIGVRQGGRVEILTGVRSGDRIIVAGTHKVLAGSLLDYADDSEAIESAHKSDEGASPAAEEDEAGGRS